MAAFALVVLCFAPLFWRLSQQGLGQPIGLLSDAGVGLALLGLLWLSPRWLRIPLAWTWTLFSLGAEELVSAMRRLPAWQDLQYLTNPAFIEKTSAGLHLAAPWLALALLLSALLLSLLPLRQARPCRLLVIGLAALVLLLGQSWLSISHDDQSVIARHNALHWFITDALLGSPSLSPEELANYPLPPSLAGFDAEGSSLLGERRAKNLLIITLEGIPGLYHPEIRAALGVEQTPASMDRLAQVTPEAMLAPDFVAHSHQTIRGLYALLCGDFSKLSWDTPKPVELQTQPQRAADCLPAQLAKGGFTTHFLQAASLGFMGKDRVMPLIGFQQVHGVEWFKEANPYPFEWGVIDEVFFRGARDYIGQLRRQSQGQQPWMLTLLTVGTHQPYAVPDEIAAAYPSRSAATVALLDRAVADFIQGLRADGVLEDTLVLITSDESHGSVDADWVSSWGLGILLDPANALPRLKQGGYGLVDVEGSLLDYFRLPVPVSVIGRSLFRDYPKGRDMLAYTASKLRWQTADGLRYECQDDGRCRVAKASSLLGPAPADFARDAEGGGQQLFTLAAVLNHKLSQGAGRQEFNFANGELRRLPERLTSDWADNLIGAQGLDFPANSRVQVSIRVKLEEGPPEGVRLRLAFKEWEQPSSLGTREFPLLQAQQEGRLEFSFDNALPRQSFSFHLLGEGAGGLLRVEEFRVQVEDAS
jgi:hypothetical protein